MDREIAEHLARDTGLRPDEIANDLEPASVDDTAKHIAVDTGVDEGVVAQSTANPVDEMVTGLPID